MLGGWGEEEYDFYAMWAMVHYREELPTLEDFLNMCP
jgi:hypothetical protein